MKQINHRGYLLVEMPEDMNGFSVVNEEGWPRIRYYKNYAQHGHVLLPSNERWEIIGKGNEITEDVWRRIVNQQKGSGKFRYYEIEGTSLAQYGSYMLHTATESGISLIKSHGMKPSETLILKLKTNE